MPGEEINTTLRFDADITDVKAAMQEATRATKLANSEFKAVAAGMDDWSSSTDGLSAKLRQLSTVQQAEERKLEVLKTAYQAVVKEQGENSAAAVDLATKINNQQAVVSKTAKEYDSYSAKLEEVERAADGAATDIKKAGDAAKDAGEAAEESGEGWTVVKDVISDLVSNVISWAVDSFMQAAEATREYRRDLAQLSQNAADAGHDMDTMKEKLSDVAAVTGETDAAMEGLNMLMASGLNTDQLVLAADALSGAATKFDGVKFEGIAEGLQETLAVGEAVGPFAEVIERTGGDLEKFNEGLAACTTQADKTNYVMDWLANSGLKDVHDAYVQNNSDLIEAEKAQFRLNEAMASVGSVTEPIVTAFTNITAALLEKLAPAAEKTIGWLLDNTGLVTPIVTGLAAAFGVLAAALAIQGIISGVQKAFALLNTTLLANPFVLVAAAIVGLVAAFATLWQNSDEFRAFWQNLWEDIKKTVSSAVDGIKKFFTTIIDFVKNNWQSLLLLLVNPFAGAFKLLYDNFDGFREYTDAFVRKVKDLITKGINSIVSFVTKTIPDIVAKTIKWVGELPGKIASAIAGAIDRVVSWGKNLASKGKQAASDLVSSVVDGVASLPGKMLSIGGNLVSGLWSGIQNSVQWLKDKISGWVGDVLGFMENLFDINSPSGETEWQGEMLVGGYVKAIKKGREQMRKAMRGLGEAGLEALGGTPSAPNAPKAAGGKTIIFNQTNNSPRALTQREIFRQTHNALAFVGGN